MVELTAACASDVEWFVNGERVTAERDGRVFWQLAAGEWNVRAVSGGKLAEQKITVENHEQLAPRLFARLTTENSLKLRQIPEFR
jgi:hypothetical protein